MESHSPGQHKFFHYLQLAKQELQELLLVHPELEKLSTREMEVFQQLLSDKTQDTIANDLFISSSSVHFHCRNIYRKLEVSGRRQILVKYKDL